MMKKLELENIILDTFLLAMGRVKSSKVCEDFSTYSSLFTIIYTQMYKLIAIDANHINMKYKRCANTCKEQRHSFFCAIEPFFRFLSY